MPIESVKELDSLKPAPLVRLKAFLYLKCLLNFYNSRRKNISLKLFIFLK